MDSQNNGQIVSRLTRALENYLIELESIVPVRGDSRTKYRLYLKDSRDYDLIRSLKRASESKELKLQ